MRKLILVLALMLALSGAASAQQLATGTLGALSDAVTAQPVATTASVAVQITGTWVGTITFQGSADGSNYVTLTVGNATTAGTATTTTSNGLFTIGNSGYQFVRATATAWTSGTANIAFMAGSGGGAAGGGGSGGSVTQGTTPWLVGGQGTAGSAATAVVTVQGIASGTSLNVGDGSGALNVICDSGCAAATSDADDGSIATGQTNSNANALGMVYNGTAWVRRTADADDASIANGQTNANSNSLGMKYNGSAWVRDTIGTAGSASAQVQTIQGVASMTPVAISAASASIASGAVASGAFASGSIASGAIASGAVAAGAFATGATSVAVDEDTPAASADRGFRSLASIQLATPADQAGDGDYTFLQMSAGRLWTSTIGNLANDGVAAATNRIPTLPVVTETSAPSRTNGRNAALSGTAGGAIRTMLTDAAGAALTVATDNTNDAAAGTTGPLVQAYAAADGTPQSAVTAADSVRLMANLNGILYTRTVDPCSGAKTAIPISISTATTTELTAALAGASNYYYVCSIVLGPTAGAQNIAIVDDDTDNCASVTSGMAGGTTAGTGFNIAANGGLTFGNGLGTIMKTGGTNRVICAVTSAAVQISGVITVVAAP